MCGNSYFGLINKMQNKFFNKTYYIVSSNVQVRKNKVYNIE